MFELSVACRYLIPRWRQLSVSIISLISVLVIGLVVWLILVFFSVTRGLEASWTQKLLAVSAPVRITPTDEYFHSYYYLVDENSLAGGYSHKSISEKLESGVSDPYDPEIDPEIPEQWPPAVRRENGELIDLVKELFAALGSMPNISAEPYEVAAGELDLHMFREDAQHQQLSQKTLLITCAKDNPALNGSRLPCSLEDQERLASLASLGSEERVVLPKSFHEAGVRVADRGHLLYRAITASSLQTQRVPIIVEGFFDPGVSPLGYRFTLASEALTSQVRASLENEIALSNGVHLYFADLDRAIPIKKALEKELDKRGIARFWRLETYHEYEYAKDLLQQLHSERNLFTLISLVIIAVACSNIISMLIILVHDKKREIGILRAMGASPQSIAAIFGICGMVMGALGSLFGIALALFTLHHLQVLVDLVSYLQGYEAFNSRIFGQTLPNEMSGEVLIFVVLTTILTSLIAGIVPAIKASIVQPAQILRSE